MGLFEQFPYTNFHELNLDWVITTVKDLEGRIDGLQETILQLANAYTDTEIAKVRADFAALEAELAAFEMDVNRQFAEYTARQDGKFKDFQELVNAQIVIMRGEIKAARDEFDGFLRQAYEYTDVQITAAAMQIPECVDRAIPNAPVYNLIEGQTQGLQSMLDYLCGLHSDMAAAVQEVIDAAKTCAEINELGKTCEEWARDGKTILGLASKSGTPFTVVWNNFDVAPGDIVFKVPRPTSDNIYWVLCYLDSNDITTAHIAVFPFIDIFPASAITYTFWSTAESAVKCATRTVFSTPADDSITFEITECTVNGATDNTLLRPLYLGYLTIIVEDGNA